MAIEILTVSLSDESVERIAQRVAQLAGGGAASYPPVGSAPQTPQSAQSPAPQPQGPDPWESATPAQQYQQQGPPQQPAQQQYQAPPQQAYQQQGQAPVCAHGPMRFVQGGVSGAGKPYAAFWGCSAPRGPGQCKSVRA